MSYQTTAPTWAAGELVGATKMNALSDGIQAPWTPFGTGANWTAISSNPAIGNGTWSGRYSQVGKSVDFSIKIMMGTTTTYGSGVWQITLPVAPNTSHPAHFDCVYTDTSAGLWFRGITIQLSGSKVSLTYDANTAGGAVAAVSSTSPYVWATSDILEVQGRYEAA